jgi:hypothetical protein
MDDETRQTKVGRNEHGEKRAWGETSMGRNEHGEKQSPRSNTKKSKENPIQSFSSASNIVQRKLILQFHSSKTHSAITSRS